MAKDNIKSSELNRYYTASDIAEHYGRKFGLKLKEIDVIKIMESQAPKSEQIGDGLYSRTANHNFEEYFRKYAESISGGVKAAKFSHEEPAMSERLENLYERFDRIKEATDNHYQRYFESQSIFGDQIDKKLQHYGRIQEHLKETQRALDVSSHTLESLYKDKDITSIEKSNRIDAILTNLDVAEEELQLAYRIYERDNDNPFIDSDGPEIADTAAMMGTAAAIEATAVKASAKDKDISDDSGFEEEIDVLDEEAQEAFEKSYWDSSNTRSIDNINPIDNGYAVEEREPDYSYFEDQYNSAPSEELKTEPDSTYEEVPYSDSYEEYESEQMEQAEEYKRDQERERQAQDHSYQENTEYNDSYAYEEERRRQENERQRREYEVIRPDESEFEEYSYQKSTYKPSYEEYEYKPDRDESGFAESRRKAQESLDEQSRIVRDENQKNYENTQKEEGYRTEGTRSESRYDYNDRYGRGPGPEPIQTTYVPTGFDEYKPSSETDNSGFAKSRRENQEKLDNQSRIKTDSTNEGFEESKRIENEIKRETESGETRLPNDSRYDRRNRWRDDDESSRRTESSTKYENYGKETEEEKVKPNKPTSGFEESRKENTKRGGGSGSDGDDSGESKESNLNNGFGGGSKEEERKRRGSDIKEEEKNEEKNTNSNQGQNNNIKNSHIPTIREQFYMNRSIQLNTREVRNAAESVKRTFKDVTGFNETDFERGKNKVKPATGTVKGLGFIGTGAIVNARAIDNLNKVEWRKIENIFRRNGIVDNATRVRVTGLANRNDYLKQVKLFIHKQGIGDFTKLSEKSLRELIASGTLTGDQRVVAESLLHVNKLGAGDKFIKIGKYTIIRAATGFAKRIGDNNDIVTGMTASIDIGSSVKMAYGAMRKAVGYGRQFVGNVQQNMAIQKATGTNPTAVLSRLSKRYRINVRPQNMKAARAISRSVRTIGRTVSNSTVGTAVRSVGSAFGRTSVGSFLKAKGAGVLSSIKNAAAAGKGVVATAVNVTGATVSSATAFAIVIAIVICIAITLLCTAIGCCVAFTAALMGYTNDAFGTSNSLLENVSNFVESITLDGDSNDEDIGVEVSVEDSVAWFALKNVAYFYEDYETIVKNGLEDVIVDATNGLGSNVSDISTIFVTDDSTTPAAANEFLYNDMSENFTLNILFSQTKGMKNIKPITYYISSNSVDQVVTGAVGSEYPYWNASEVLAMSSVRYSNSINPYNYRRYNRLLRYDAYGCDIGIIKQAAGWFSDVFGKDESDLGDVKLARDEIFVADTEINSEIDGTIDPNYTGEENVYIGFTTLTNDDMSVLTNDKHIYQTVYIKTSNEHYNKDIQDGFERETRELFQNNHLCNNYDITITSQEVYEKDYHDDGVNYDRVFKETRYTFKFTCKGHKLVQAYVRCPTLQGTGNLYEVDDENDSIHQDLLQALVNKIFPQDYEKWSDADIETDEGTNIVVQKRKVAAEEAKQEVAEMLTENWETTYGFKWEDMFDSPSQFDLYGSQISQGIGEMATEDGTLTAFGVARDYVDEKLEEIQLSTSQLDQEYVRRIEVIDAATSYAGRLKYYYGATDVENGISDCSAFISDALGIGRTTTADIMGWEQKAFSELEPGDLLCKDGHVRMFICAVTVNGQYRFLTVENTSGSGATNYVSGCSCAYYSVDDLVGEGYIGIDVSNHMSM